LRVGPRDYVWTELERSGAQVLRCAVSRPLAAAAALGNGAMGWNRLDARWSAVAAHLLDVAGKLLDDGLQTPKALMDVHTHAITHTPTRPHTRARARARKCCLHASDGWHCHSDAVVAVSATHGTQTRQG
jgi:hypothetical protein